MYKVKAGMALSLALNNCSREEALSAFSMALTYAAQGGFNLSTLHKIEIHESKSIDTSLEVELVNNYYNALKEITELSFKIESQNYQLNKMTKSLVEIESALTITVSKLNLANRVTEKMRLQRDEASRALEEICSILMNNQSEFK